MITRMFHQHRLEQKHRLMMRFIKSGYRDHEAWRQFIVLFEERTR